MDNIEYISPALCTTLTIFFGGFITYFFNIKSYKKSERSEKLRNIKIDILNQLNEGTIIKIDNLIKQDKCSNSDNIYLIKTLNELIRISFLLKYLSKKEYESICKNIEVISDFYVDSNDNKPTKREVNSSWKELIELFYL